MKKQIRTGVISTAALAATLILNSCSSTEESAEEQRNVFTEGTTHIALEGEENFRDLGGITTSDGKRVLYGKLFRSGELSGLTDEDSVKVLSLGIEQMFDLRTPGEVEEDPDRVNTHHTDVHFISLLGDEDISGESGLGALLGSGDPTAIAAGVDAFMMETYKVDQTKIDGWKEIFDSLETGKSSHWHCTSGKDRVGMTTVLVLSALGADSATCVANFMESNVYLAESAGETVAYLEQMILGMTISKIEASIKEAYPTMSDAEVSAAAQAQVTDEMKLGITAMAEAMRPIGLVEQSWIEAFYASIYSQFGDMDTFLTELGVDREVLRKQFLES